MIVALEVQIREPSDILSPNADLLKRVVLAISAFRSDTEVVRLLEQVFAHGISPFAGVLVVDSLTSGAIERAIDTNGWPVTFHNSQVNLGAAGNLRKRMELAARFDADWCYALNGDSEFKLETILALVRCGAGKRRVGAIFPARANSSADQRWSRAGTSFLPFRSPLTNEATPPAEREVAWASSNGALYHLEPARNGLFVWTDLWHAWEDMAYSWLLSVHGWKQIACSEAVFVDGYERRAVRLFGRRFHIHDKPPWLSYYSIRNLAIFVHRTKAGLAGWALVGSRLFQESALTIMYRDNKLARLTYLARGLVDGLRKRTGMTVSPTPTNPKGGAW